MYHAVLESEAAVEALAPEDREYAITRATFERDLSLLKARGFEVLSPEMPLPGGKAGVLLTFDDALGCHAETALPILQQWGHKALFFLDTARLDGKPEGPLKPLTTEEAKQLTAAGQSLGSHAHRHLFLSSLDQETLKIDLTKSREILESLQGKPCPDISFPGGRFNKTVLSIAAEIGFNRCFSSLCGSNKPGDFLWYRFARRRGQEPALLDFLARNPWQWAMETARTWGPHWLRQQLGDKAYLTLIGKSGGRYSF